MQMSGAALVLLSGHWSCHIALGSFWMCSFSVMPPSEHVLHLQLHSPPASPPGVANATCAPSLRTDVLRAMYAVPRLVSMVQNALPAIGADAALAMAPLCAVMVM